MSTVTVNQGGIGVEFSDTLTIDDIPVDLTGLAVRFFLKDQLDVTVVDEAATIISTTGGEVEYVSQAGDLDTLGSFKQTWVVDGTDTYPSTGWNTVIVQNANPTGLIITADDLAAFLRITDNFDDTLLGYAANAANQAVIEYCGRTFGRIEVADATPRIYRPTDQARLTVDDFWELSALEVDIDTGDTGSYTTAWTANTDFVVEPFNGLLVGQQRPYMTITAVNQYFPIWNRRPSVQVTAAWGWETIPPAVFQATLLKGARIFRRKDSVDGILPGFADFGAVRISRFEDADVMLLLGPYRRPELAILLG